jgi:uncharacterized RDD family membrane protein YckC
MNTQIFIYRDGQQHGPFTKEQILEMIQNESVSRNDFYWIEGLSEWIQIGCAFDERSHDRNLCGSSHLNQKNLIEINNYGGFWIRFVAYIIDMVAIYIAGWPFSKLFTALGSISSNSSPYYSILDVVIGLIISWIYFAGYDSSTNQGTIGKQLLGLKIIDANGKRITFGRATVRHFSQILSGLLLCLGYLMIGWTKKKRGLHDFIADTYVIKTKGQFEKF